MIGFDGIYIGGGNTYSLLHEFRAAGFLPVLRHAIHEGVCVYGGSAGAVVLGADISTVRQIDTNDVGLVDTKAVDVAGGLAVSVHYTRDHDQPISTDVAETGLSVVAIPEDAGVVLIDDYIRATGSSPVMLFTPGATPTKLAPADTSRDPG